MHYKCSHWELITLANERTELALLTNEKLLSDVSLIMTSIMLILTHTVQCTCGGADQEGGSYFSVVQCLMLVKLLEVGLGMERKPHSREMTV